MNKEYRLSLIILFIINLIIIFLVDVFTFKIYPHGHISGNGNPAIILWFIEIPIYVALLILICLVKNENYIRIISSGYALVINASLLLINVYYQYIFAVKIYATIEGRIDRYATVNQYTNTVFINYHTFSIGIFATLLVVGLLWRFKSKRNGNRIKPQV